MLILMGAFLVMLAFVAGATISPALLMAGMQLEAEITVRTKAFTKSVVADKGVRKDKIKAITLITLSLLIPIIIALSGVIPIIVETGGFNGH